MAKVETCRTDYEELYQEVLPDEIFYTNKGNEQMLKELVVEHGAVMTAIAIDLDIYDEWATYTKGIWTKHTNKGRVN